MQVILEPMSNRHDCFALRPLVRSPPNRTNMHKSISPHGLLRRPLLCVFLLLIGCARWMAGAQADTRVSDEPRVAVLAYHRFSETAADDFMTVRVATFEAQLSFLRAHGYRIVALRDIVNWLTEPEATLPAKAVALTIDDGHQSVYDVLMPIAVREHLPCTLFIYPSAISNASYALTWTQLTQLRQTGLFDVQSHTYWHPNFNVERARRTPSDFRSFAAKQLVESRERIEAKLGLQVDLLAWPFGIVDTELISMASSAGYRAAFTISGRLIDRHSPLLSVPRLLITDADTPAVLSRRLGESKAQAAQARVEGRRP